MSGLFTDFPEWSPEQRLSVALVEVLRLKRELKYPRPTPANAGAIIPPCPKPAEAGTQSEESQP